MKNDRRRVVIKTGLWYCRCVDSSRIGGVRGVDIIIVDDDPIVCKSLSMAIKTFYTWGEIRSFTDVDMCIAADITYLLEKPVKPFSLQLAVRAIVSKFIKFARRLLNDPSLIEALEGISK